ncbi:MAG: hypothetical protein JO082_08090 [Mycobacterium sp.]|nr:hypothetical protein [Mycobacterium sp.]MBV9721862.1 hypothetical protein [Mycobacterium sp.]
MPDDDVDELYLVRLSDFTALRGKLATAAKQRGDTATANRISAARKPTTAAWVVNRLVLQRKESKQRLKDLGDRLRAAHADMDAERIRDLSKERHQLIDELTSVALHTAEVNNPSAALREDVAKTLESAIADADVTAKLGRLDRAERYSGFGAFGAVSPATEEAPRRNLGKLRAKLAAAERAKAAADEALSEREQAVATAQRSYAEARRRLREAKSALDAADKALDRAKHAAHEAAGSVADIKGQLRQR